MPGNNETYEELRDFLCQYFLDKERLEITNTITPFAQLENFASKTEFGFLDFSPKSSVSSVLKTVLWDMVADRIIGPEFGIPANPPGDIGIRAFRLTEYGKQLPKGLPIDRPDKYLDYLKSQIPDIDSQIIVYVRESLHSYKLGCYFASSVMLGVASERLFELLIDVYTNAIQDQSNQDRFRKRIAGKGISQQYEEFKKKLPDLTGKNGITLGDGPSTARFRQEFKHAIEITFESIRSYRNYAAHPRDGEVPRHIIKGNLDAFPLFCQRLYQGIGWFGSSGNDQAIAPLAGEISSLALSH